MATVAPEPMPRKGFFRRFGEVIRDGWNAVVRTVKRAWGAVTRFFGRTFRAAQRGGKVVAARTRRFGVWAGGKVASVGRWTWTQATKLPGVFRRVFGWTLRLGSYAVQASLVAVIIFMLAFAGLGFVAGMAKDGWDDNVHDRVVNMSKGEEFWDKDAAAANRAQKAQQKAHKDDVVIGEVVPIRPVKEEPIVTPDKVSGPRKDVYTFTAEEMNDMLLNGWGPPEGTPDHDLERFWKSMSKHFALTDKDLSSFFFGCALAARSFLKEPRSRALTYPAGWFIAQEAKVIDQRNQQAGRLGKPELSLNAASVKRGMKYEVERLQALYSAPAEV